MSIRRWARGCAVVCVGLGALVIFSRKASPSIEAAHAEAVNVTPAPTPQKAIAPVAKQGAVYTQMIEGRRRVLLRSPAPAEAGTTISKTPIIALHGMCGYPDYMCSPLEPAATGRSWLVCPQANSFCGDGDGASWGGPLSVRKGVVEAAMASATKLSGGALDLTTPRVLVGFSQGAHVALSIALQSPKTYKGLLLVGMKVSTDASSLRGAGIERIVLASGDYDAAGPTMRDLATALVKQGFPARYVSLGKFGHNFPPEIAPILATQIDWLDRSTQ